MKRIAIQGAKGSFHDITAHRYFAGEEIEILYCARFEDIFTAIKKDDTVIGLMAIENTIAGSLLQNHELLRESDSQIIGEARLHISHSIMCLPEDDWKDIHEVSSHPIALMQCREFLNAHPEIKAVEAEDTAKSAEDIFKNKLHGHAAICGKLAAEIYHMNVLAEGIETNKRNFTRFLILADPFHSEILTAGKRINKSSLVFSLPHTQGSLSKVLTILSFYDINLSKIQSMPIIGREWEYRFYIDLTFDNFTRYKQSLEAIRPLTKDFKILGEYAEFDKPL